VYKALEDCLKNGTRRCPDRPVHKNHVLVIQFVAKMLFIVHSQYILGQNICIFSNPVGNSICVYYGSGINIYKSLTSHHIHEDHQIYQSKIHLYVPPVNVIYDQQHIQLWCNYSFIFHLDSTWNKQGYFRYCCNSSRGSIHFIFMAQNFLLIIATFKIPKHSRNVSLRHTS